MELIESLSIVFGNCQPFPPADTLATNPNGQHSPNPSHRPILSRKRDWKRVNDRMRHNRNDDDGDVNALTGCEKCNRTDDRIAYCKYCPEHGDCFWISNIICRMQMIRVNVFDFGSHDCFTTRGCCCQRLMLLLLLLLSTNLYAAVHTLDTVFDWFAPANTADRETKK